MTTLPLRLSSLLTDAASQLRAAGAEAAADGLEALARQAHDNCTVAVVGRVKAGKSSFINALLGDELAAVGETETTATINHFRNGTPPEPGKPVLCHWRGGRVEAVSRAFLDSLQSNDIETLRRADGIDHLEYLLPDHPLLQGIALVDTPGIGAMVEEHENRTAEFMGLFQALRARHSDESGQLSRSADAVIYVLDANPRETDRDALEGFGYLRATNAIGVMARLELNPDAVARRHDLAAATMRQLGSHINTVLPVCTAVRRALDRWHAEDPQRFATIAATLRQIPPARLDMMLKRDRFFLEQDFDNCPVPAATRRALVAEVPWGGFVTIVRCLRDHSFDAAAATVALDELAGFGPLLTRLKEHFIQRGWILRCHRIVGELMVRIQFTELPSLAVRAEEDALQLRRFLDFVDAARGDPATAEALRIFLRGRLASDIAGRQQAAWQDLLDRLAGLKYELEGVDADFRALQRLEDEPEAFTPAELDELRALLGLYGLDTAARLRHATPSPADLTTRQQHWSLVLRTARRGSARQAVAERARARYGAILAEGEARERG